MIEAAELKSPNMLGEIKINNGEIVQEIVFTDKEVIVLGIPRDEEDFPEDDHHNCDFLGCGQCHVLRRFKLAHLQKDWMPISKGLPEESGKYNITRRGYRDQPNFTSTAYYAGTLEKWFADISSDAELHDVIAYRPLPSAYEGEGK